MSHGSRLFGRREFTISAGAVGLAALVGGRGAEAGLAAAPGIRIGYAAITWGDKSVKTAIGEIAEAGYPGIQLRGNITKDYQTPAELKADLDQAKLTFACLSGGGPSADPAKRQEEVDKFVKAVEFAKGAGVLAVQATSPKRTTDKIEKAELESFADTLTAIGKKTAELGVPLVFHPHMAQIGQDPADVEVILKRSNPRYVKLLLDTGHWAAAGGDPVKAVKKYAKRIAVLHIKDVKDKEPSTTPGPDGKIDTKKYVFVELGQGKVDFKAVFAALKAARWKGWAVVELDSVPAGRAPKEAAVANRKFLESLGLSVLATT